MVSVNEEETVLILRAIDSKVNEYNSYPTEMQEAFLTPYVQLREGLIKAHEAEQKKKSLLPKK